MKKRDWKRKAKLWERNAESFHAQMHGMEYERDQLQAEASMLRQANASQGTRADSAESDRDARQKRVAQLEANEDELIGVANTAVDRRLSAEVHVKRLQKRVEELEGELQAAKAFKSEFSQLQADFGIVCEERDGLKREVEVERRLAEDVYAKLIDATNLHNEHHDEKTHHFPLPRMRVRMAAKAAAYDAQGGQEDG